MKDREIFNTMLKSWVRPIINPPVGPPEDDKGLPPFIEAEAFREFAREWAMRLQDGEDDSLQLSLILLAFLREYENNKVYSSFIVWMSIREWPKVREALSKHLDTNGKKALSLQTGELFYKEFKSEVLRQIRDYWKALEEGQPLED